jgi:transposase
MVRRRISEAQRWQIIGMHTTGMSFKAIGRQMGYHYTVVSRLVRKHTQTNNVKDLPRSGRPRVTSDRDDRALQRLVRRMPFATSPVLKQHWLPNRRLSTRTVRNRLKSAGLKSRRVIKRPLLADRHRRTRLAWCLARRGWNLRTWRKIHWSDESRFLLHVTDGRMRVWRHKNTAYTPRNIQPTVPYGGGSVMVWGCISHDCKLDLVTIQGNLTGDQYIRDVLQPVVVPHFDNHPLATRPVYMDDNARPHRSRAVTAYLQSEAVTSVPWPAMSLDLNPIEHIWDMLGRRIQAREPPVQNIRQLEAALHREWQQLSQQDIRRLTGGMRRRVEAVIQARGDYTRY